MKQMIKNHETIESLEDFIYYDKSTGKIKITKPVVDGSGKSISATKNILGQSSLFYDDYTGSITFENTSSFNYQDYDLLLLTIMGSLFVFISSQVIATNSGAKSCCSMMYDTAGNSTIMRAKLTKLAASDNNLQITFVSPQQFAFESEHPYGILIGVKL